MSSRPPLAPGKKPVIGHSASFLRAPLESLERWGNTDDGIVRIQIAGREICLVTAPETVKQVLVTDREMYQKAEIVRDRLGTLQGGSLVLLEGEDWHERRNTLRPALSPERMGVTASLTTERASEMVEEWPHAAPVELVEAVRTLVLEILAEALFGLEREAGTPIDEAAGDILARMDMRTPSTYLPEWVPTPTNLRFRRAVSTLHDRLDTIVGQRASGGEQRSNQDRTADDSLLSLMLEVGLEPETVRNELIALLFAGYDSTATALACTLAALGDHPAVQAALRTELKDVLAGQTPTPGDLAGLPLLDAVVKESLRLYPPQYILFREPTKAVNLQGYRIESGTTIVLPPWTIQRDEQFWDDPESFRPKRWLESTSATGSRPEYAYFPYGGGPRRCLGAGLANQILKLALAVVCQRRQLQLAGALSVSAGPTLAVNEDLKLRSYRDHSTDDG